MEVGGGGVCVRDEAIRGVVISAFHFAVQLERSRFQIHPHTGTAREKAGEGAAQGGWGCAGEGWGPFPAFGESYLEWSIAFTWAQAMVPSASTLYLKATQGAWLHPWVPGCFSPEQRGSGKSKGP